MEGLSGNCGEGVLVSGRPGPRLTDSVTLGRQLNSFVPQFSGPYPGVHACPEPPWG